MDSLTLYRGDYQNIDEFVFHKTSKWCLVGQGVYLTTSVEVANSYRNKGADWRDPRTRHPHGVHTLFHGQANNREEAHEKAFKAYSNLEMVQDSILRIPKKQREQYLRDQFRDMLEDNQVTSKYTSREIDVRLKKVTRTIEVLWDTNRWLGYVSRFVFPKNHFEQSVFNVDKPMYDRGLLEDIWDTGLAKTFLRPYTEREEYIRRNLGVKVMEWSPPWTRFRSILEPYGYRGFEYNGGKRIGGYGPHRAFCIWDDEWVNKHRVK